MTTTVTSIDRVDPERFWKKMNAWETGHPDNYKWRMLLDIAMELLPDDEDAYDFCIRLQSSMEACMVPADTYSSFSGKATLSGAAEVLKKLYPDNSFAGLEAWLPKADLYGIDREPDPLRLGGMKVVADPFCPRDRSYMAIGTGPWPDDDDTGDPPSTLPMGHKSTYSPVAEPAQMAVDGPCGVTCKRCNDKNDFAEPNQPDGGYVCFSCR